MKERKRAKKQNWSKIIDVDCHQFLQRTTLFVSTVPTGTEVVPSLLFQLLINA